MMISSSIKILECGNYTRIFHLSNCRQIPFSTDTLFYFCAKNYQLIIINHITKKIKEGKLALSNRTNLIFFFFSLVKHSLHARCILRKLLNTKILSLIVSQTKVILR